MNTIAATTIRAGSELTGPTLKLQGGTIVAYRDGGHRILEDGEVVISGDRIVSVGPRSETPADRVVHLDGRLVIPGLISTHAHIGAHEATRLIIDGGRREFMRSGFLNYVPTRGDGGPSLFQSADREASVRFGFAQLLRNGVTTVLGFAPQSDEVMIEAAGDSGLRLYYAPTANTGRYYFNEEGSLGRVMNETEGLRQLERAIEFIATHDGAHGERIRGIVVVDEFYNSSPTLRQAARTAAQSLGVGLTMHFCEQLFEFHETVRRTGLTPVQMLEREGILGPDVILAHAIYLAGHSLTSYPYVDDLAIIAGSGTNVAHSPAVFARRGIMMESFSRYREAGINIAIGTDVFPMDLMEEMRFASVMGKVADRNHEAASASDVFEAATLGGAQALGRSDLGRIATGCKADIVVIDLDNMWTAPFADPIRALVTSGHPTMIDMVLVDGRILWDNQERRRTDEVLGKATQSMRAVERYYSEWRWDGRSIKTEFPPSFPAW